MVIQRQKSPKFVNRSLIIVNYISNVRYKTELALGVKREEAIKSEAEQELKLMKIKCENLERKAYSSQEELVKDLTYARDVVSE